MGHSMEMEMGHSSTSRAHAPAHITGFFAPHMEEDARKSGSVGCGITLSQRGGCVVAGHGTSYRGKQVSCRVVERALAMLGIEGVGVHLYSDAPVGCGLGMSGAFALSACMAACQHLKTPKTMREILTAAHCSEVECRTGLGDVVAQCTGGLVMRLKPGIPPIGEVDCIPTSPAIISYVARGRMDTSEVLTEMDTSKIGRLGRWALRQMLKKPTLEQFFRLSRDFARESGLATPWVLDVMEAVEAEGGLCSMAMLGECVFALGVPRALEEFGTPHVCYLSTQRAGLG
ncbi:MAG: pantoate kinase [Methanosarcinales archaeon]|nr:MAG: GHMP kinase ATP-binding protein, putative [Euryarchaeota archaeon 55_53]KUK30246.1 MAG: GHMP kinase ATP-binding protein, putative [Methanosarcinales archeaon 56_1174]MDI3487580.1 pantoate kinase [Methanosarcinales archaeon]MDN5294729.1 pantoate kinase [Methanosarcinales archaeon]